MRTPPTAILRKSTYRIYPGWKSRRTEQACKNSRSICKKTAASGAVDGTDCRCADGAYAGKRRNRDDRGGAYVHDYARNQEAGKPDSDAGKTWSLRDRPGTGRTIFPHVGEIAMLMEKYIEMPRLNAVWNHPLYQKYYRENEKIEHDREFCCHQITHLLDVARIAYIKNLEAGLGIDKELIYTAAILHDIGKALDHDMEGTHVQIGVDILKKFKENPLVINAVEAHHGDVEPQTLEAVLVQAADAISASRPGARRETLEAYIKRLENLESIADSFDGVEKSFAIQAGREVRIIVKPEKISDDQMTLLARDVSKRIEDEMDYPGQIKVNIIRETRIVDYAK